MSLNDKQKRFCEEYLIDLNATQAAIRSGYSEKTANRIASENLSKLDIQKYIAKLQKSKSEELDITINDILLIEWGIAIAGEKDSDRLKATDQLSKKLGFYEKDNKQKEVNVNLINLGTGLNPE